MKNLISGATLFAAILVIGCQPPETDAVAEDGNEQTMDSLLTAYEQAWESGDAAAFDDLLAPGFTRTVNDGEGYGIDSLKAAASGEGRLVDLSIDLEESVYSDNVAAVSWSLSGMLGGQPVSTTGASFISFEDGMIVSDRVVIDEAPIMEAMMQAAGEGEMQPGDEAGEASDTTSM